MDLSELFEKHRDRQWFFVSPGGNWGDHLIYAGAEALARRLGVHWVDLDYKTFEAGAVPADAAIYLHGGGGLNSWCSGRAFTNLEKALRSDAALVIQGPQTSETGNADIDRRFETLLAQVRPGEVHFFARESTTKRYFDMLTHGAVQMHLDHDTAMHLTQSEVLALGHLSELPRGRYLLMVARQDNEAPATGIEARRNVVTMDPAYYARSFPHWIRIHAHAQRIVSNRLHSAIVSCLLRRPIEVLGGAYHKNRSIWEYSLRERGVQWLEVLPDEPQPSRRLHLLPARLRDSWKVQRAIMRMRGVPAE